MKKKIIIRIILILLITLTAILISRFFAGAPPKKIAPLSDKQQKELFEDFDALINNNPLSARLSFDDFKNGFWYRKKNGNEEDVYFFNTPQLMKEGFSKKQILTLIGELLKGVIIVKKEDMDLLEMEKLPDNLQFHNKLYESVLDGTYNDIKEYLLNKKNKNAQDYMRLSEIFGLEGDYTKEEKYLRKACNLDSSIEICHNINIKISGKIIDNKGVPVPNAEVKVISNSKEKSILSNSDGTYTLELDIHSLQKNRFSFSKNEYATTFYDFTSFSDEKTEYHIPTIILYKGLKSFIINNKESKENFVLKAFNSKYTIPNDAFYLDGKKYQGEIHAYIYEFQENDVPPTFLNLDAFSSGSGFAGTNMITSGMPYIVFQTKNGKTIHVRKNNPMVLEFRLKTITELLDKGYLTEDYFNRSFEHSSKGEYILTLGYIIKNNIPLAPFWVLDQKTGVWHNEGFNLVDRRGLYKSIFYTTIK